MSKPKILIIGCGAVGLAQGYHLSDGADITYLVRPGRSSAFAPPRKLYDYQANELRVFSNYRLIESASEVAGEEFYCVFDSLDGFTAQTEGGVATLKSVGDVIRNAPDTFVVYDAVGVDMETHYVSTMGISRDRITFAASMLAHQPTPSISIPASADRELVAQAHLLYAAFPGKVGLVVVNKSPKLTNKLEVVYKQNGRLGIQKLPAMFGGFVLLGILQLSVWNLDGWKDFSHLRNNKELWNLLLRAQSEILALPLFGWTGWLLSWVMGSWATSKLFTAPASGSEPLDYREFNMFHHGSKVAEQDVQTLEELVAAGEKAKQKMPALREICQKAYEVQKAKDVLTYQR
ncbi:hypothetical protein N0V83_003807 [Neocucurbitaria cava]|uniref:Ketopantoate reductase N-terminal domain-containing protein n=1 Tax=Neocucurbitaria cava TaxID=798079 RepID=A0A9W8YAM5_9PLEO|nr:hypothetical protein N0V83_003807 [Neocucurbitaria cava]